MTVNVIMWELDNNEMKSHQAKKRNSYIFKNVFLISLLMLFFILIWFSGCKEFKNPAGPDNPIEPPVKYDLEVTYIRIDVARPELLYINNISFSIYLLSYTAGKISIMSDTFSQIDDYNFRGEASNISSINAKNALYAMYTVDPSRGDGIEDSTMVVAERYIVKVKETGFETELKDIRGNSVHPYGGKMACFILTQDGKIISRPNSSY